jgi:hypothetical protein
MASVHLFQGEMTTKPKQAEAEGFLARRQAESLELSSRKQTKLKDVERTMRKR